MELWAGKLGACKCEKSPVGTEIGMKWSIGEPGGLALRAGESALARMGPLSLALYWIPLFFMT